MKTLKNLTKKIVMLIYSMIMLSLSASAADKRPNILLILTDDLGFSDIGCYGSEIETPVLDRLAANGLRFSQFYNTAKCHSSRVSLLSGRWCMQAGDVKLNRAVTIPEIIAPGGYFTAMTGKWHLTGQPHDFGFQRFFGHLSGACNYYRGDRTFRLNGEHWDVPESGFYTTVANVDFALEFLRENRPAGKPWFLYIAFNAPHAPLQPLQQDYDKYLGRYNCGWDEIQKERLARQRELKLLPPTAEAWPRPQNIPAWQELTPQLRDWESRRMAAYAALIERIDTEIGRVVAELESTGELDNTLIMFFSDNGACPYDRISTQQDGNPCGPDVSWSDSTGWAWARNTPFRYYKQNQYEGGITTPAIMHWPAGIRREKGSICRTPAHLVDVLPTVAELAKTPLPEQYPGRELSALAGISLAPILRGGELPERPPIHLMFNQDRGLRDGNWKIVSFQSKAWELYNIVEDRTESVNLADRYPERVAAMAAQWHKTAQDELRAPEHLIQPVATDDTTPHLHREWSDYSGHDGMRTSIRKVSKRKNRKNSSSSAGIRARRDTSIQLKDNEIILNCSDGDPGIAIDSLGAVTERGPYQLVFEANSNAGGDGEIYFTTTPKKSLPQGERVNVTIPHDNQWHQHTITLQTDKLIHALRVDLCSTAGTVRLRNLKLQTMQGTTLKSWP